MYVCSSSDITTPYYGIKEHQKHQGPEAPKSHNMFKHQNRAPQRRVAYSQAKSCSGTGSIFSSTDIMAPISDSIFWGSRMQCSEAPKSVPRHLEHVLKHQNRNFK